MNISFALTTRQFKDRTKTVTRRLGWKNLRPSAILTACEKCQGLKKGEKIVKLGLIRVVSVRREPLGKMIEDRDYGFLECVNEGFPDKAPGGFVAMFCEHNNCRLETEVTRIEFEYL